MFFMYSYWAGITTPRPKLLPNVLRISFRSSAWFAPSCGRPPRLSCPGHSQSMSTPWKFHFARNCCRELMKALRFSLVLDISDHVCCVAPASENSNPPMPIHLETLSGRARNCLYMSSSSGFIGRTSKVFGSIVAKARTRCVRPETSS
jgi:hypothetical protein